MGLAETRDAICTAIDAIATTIDAGTGFTRLRDQLQAFTDAAAMRARLYQVKMSGVPRVSRWSVSNGRDVLDALLTVDVAYPVAGWTRYDGHDDAMASDVPLLISAIGAPSVWSTTARNVSVLPDPTVDIITGEGGQAVAYVLSISVLVEYAT